MFDSYCSWPGGFAQRRSWASDSIVESPHRPFYSPLLQPLPLLRCFCYIRPCRLDFPGSLSSSSRPFPAIHNFNTSHAFDCERGR